MRILVTGGAGFLGSVVAERLAAEDHEVVVLDLRPADRHPAGVTAVTGDVRDAALVAGLLRGIDAVVHHAAVVGPGGDATDLPGYVGGNDLGTAVLLAEAARAGIGRVVLASSTAVYGEGGYACPAHGRLRPGRRAPFDLAAGRFEPTCPRCAAPLLACQVEEDAPVAPRTVYAATKVAQEHLAAAWAGLTGGTALALRYAAVYGPGVRTGVAATFRDALDRGEPPRVLEDGAQRRDFVHVTDAARATVAAVRAAGRDGFRAYHVCSGRPRTVGELATALATACAGPAPVITGRFRAEDVRHLLPSDRRARAELGFSARVTLADGVADLVPARA